MNKSVIIILSLLSLFITGCKKKKSGFDYYEKGRKFLDKEKTPDNLSKAFEMFIKACKKGYGGGCYQAGILLQNGEGVSKDLKRAAEDAFILEALSKKKPSIKESHNKYKLARALATSFNIKDIKFDIDSSSYTMSGVVEYIPFFLKHN